MNGHIFFISGPSGVGKGTIISALKENYEDFLFPPSATTRKPRPGEIPGETYIYLSDEEFDEYIKEEKLLEYATVHGGARYGTLKEKIVTPAEEGNVVIREFDVQGFASAKEKLPRHYYTSIFLAPADDEATLRQRIQDRAPISEDELQNRMDSLKKETKASRIYDYIVHSHHGQVEKLYEDVNAIITGKIVEMMDKNDE